MPETRRGRSLSGRCAFGGWHVASTQTRASAAGSVLRSIQPRHIRRDITATERFSCGCGKARGVRDRIGGMRIVRRAVVS